MKDERGFALVLTLMILVIITALVTEFSYGVFTTTSALNNWKESQRLSFAAKSGVTLAVKTISDFQKNSWYTYPDRIEIPVENILEGFTGRVMVTAEDETSRFNLNSLVNEIQTDNQVAIQTFKNLLRNLNLDEKIADRVTDWIDKDTTARFGNSEEAAKNGFMDAPDELLLIKGIDQPAYEKLRPYVTVFGPLNIANVININTAARPVIMSLYNNQKDIAERIIQERERKPFSMQDNLDNRGYVQPGNVIYKSGIFHIRVVAEENRIKRVIESVVTISESGAATIKYWKEM